MVDARLTTLRRQLGALSYDAGGLTAEAAPLVAALLNDLVKATDSYRAVKAEAGKVDQASQTLQYKADVLKREVARLSGENSRLHQDLLREADARRVQEGASYERGKQLEARAAELAFAKQQALERAAALERERDGLHAKVRDVLSFRQRHAGDELELKAAFSDFSITAPLEPRPAPAAAAKTSRGAISLIKAADSRILALEADVRQREAELQALGKQLQQAKDAVAQRDGEIERLSAQLAQGPDVDRLAQQYRNEANEAVILQLNQQVETLTAELVEVQRRAVDRSELEAAQQAQQQAEARASALTAERETVAREVEHMKAALVRLQQEAAGEGAARQKLARLRATLDGVRAEKALLEGQLTHAEAKVAELRDRLEQREAALRKAQNRSKQLEADLYAKQQQQQQQPSGSQEEATAAASLQEQIESLSEQLAAAKRSQQEAVAAAAESQTDCQQLRSRVQQLEQQLQGAQQQFLRAEQQLSEAMAAASTPLTGQDGAEQPPTTTLKPAEHDGSKGHKDAAAFDQAVERLTAELERLEFERTELLVKLEESEKQVASLTAAASGRQHDGTAVAGKNSVSANGLDGGISSGSEDWQLAAGTMQVAQEGLPTTQQEERQHLQLRVDELDSQVAALQRELEVARASGAATVPEPSDLDDLRRQLQERSQEVADLSALSIKADATVQQYMAQLRSMATELRAAELRLKDADARLGRQAEESQRHEAEMAELRGVVGALDAERDALQAELDRRAENAAAEASALAAQRRRAEEAERALAATEARLAAANTRLQEQEQVAQQQHAEREALGQQLGGLEAEYGALREEYRAVTSDLAALVKENQVVSNQLSSMTAERHELAEQIKVQSTRSHYNEQLARAREQDVAELRTAYEGMSHENQRLQQSLTELTRELQARELELITRAEEVASLHEAQRSAQSQINMYISDLQAYERQLEAMSRAMQRGDDAAEGLDRERRGLLEQLRVAEQVRFQLERAQEALQRKLVHAEGGIGVLEARLADAQSDSEALKQRIALEQARVGELEGLLAIARADQYKRDAVAAERGPERQLASLQEQKRLLEEQVATLQRQVDGLVQRREAQDEELAKLRSRLAAEFEAGANRGSQAAKERGEALADQLVEVQQRCLELAAEADAQRAEAARLAGARDGAQAALHAAQTELEEVKALLLQQEAAGNADMGAVSAAAASARLVELEQHNSQLAEQLQAIRAHAGMHADSAADVGGRLDELQQENERLLGLLSHMDSERARLARERQELLGELAQLRATPAEPKVAAGSPTYAHGPGSSSQDGSGGGSRGGLYQEQQMRLEQQVGQLEQQQRQLEQELHAEQRRRQQAEHDFQELLSTMDSMQSSASPTSSSGSLPHAPQAYSGFGGHSNGGVSDGGMAGPPLQQQPSMQLQVALNSLQHIAHGLSSISGGPGNSLGAASSPVRAATHGELGVRG